MCYNSIVGNCNFESARLSVCGWSNAKNGLQDDFDWLSHTGNTTSRNTGPPYDHTRRNPQGKFCVKILHTTKKVLNTNTEYFELIYMLKIVKENFGFKFTF